MTETQPIAPSPPQRGARPLWVVGALVIAGLLIYEVLRAPGSGPTPPIPLPPLRVQGWLNTDRGGAPSRESLQGRYVVVDAWATWCYPCRVAMPRLAQAHDRWAQRGVVFIGLTSETADQARQVADYAATVPGFDWPIGYGAGMVWDQLGIDAIPTILLFGPDGRAVWRGMDIDRLERELYQRVGE